MGRGLSKRTKLVIEAWRDLLGDYGIGDINPEIDDVAEVYRKRVGIRTADAHLVIITTLPRIMDHFEGEGWYPSRYTPYFLAKFKGQAPDHPTTDVEIAKSVAGQGNGATVGLHFCTSEDCYLFIESRCRGFDKGTGLHERQIDRMKGAAESGQLTRQGATAIATKSRLPASTASRVKRIGKSQDAA